MATITGTPGNDKLTGTPAEDSIQGLGGNDFIDGRGGGDFLTGGSGDDVYIVHGDADRDHEQGVDDVILENGNEGYDTAFTDSSIRLWVGPSGGGFVEVLSTRQHSDTTAMEIIGSGTQTLVYGNFGNNTLGGGAFVYGFRGDDTYVDGGNAIEAVGQGIDTVLAQQDLALWAGSEIEFLTAVPYPWSGGGNWPSALTGNEFSQRITGNFLNNVLDSGVGAPDVLVGGLGNDTYRVRNRDDQVMENDGEGRDQVSAYLDYTLPIGLEIEVLTAGSPTDTTPTQIVGNELSQALIGNAGANFLNGAGGSDTMEGMQGDDTFVIDTVGDYVYETGGEGNDAILTFISFGLASGSSIELLSAAVHADTVGLNLFGNEYAQTVHGNNGNDTLDGGGGNDVLVGLGGFDTFAFSDALAWDNIDRIEDFNPLADTIALDSAIFQGLANGTLSPQAFRAGAAAQDADDRILHDSQTGALSFDRDGNGAEAAVQFALVQPGLTLMHDDFFIL